MIGIALLRSADRVTFGVDMDKQTGRRELLKLAGGVGAGLLAGGASAQPVTSGQMASRLRTLRFAHFTDVHVKPERGADRGFIAALQHAHALDDPPELLVNGGDVIMDALGQTAERTQTQWDLLHRILDDHCRLPIEHCLGNHDIWGWYTDKSGTTGDEPKWGKACALEQFQLEKPYRSFDRAGWHFVILDSVQLREGGGAYVARLDDEQFEWLQGDLADTPDTTPVVVVSHIPIVAVTPMFFKNEFTDNDPDLSAALIHTDLHRIKDLFARHGNVKLCLSGHIHLVDRVEYLGTTYICDGAVSGAWWGGDWHECDEGYGVIDLYDDGSFEHQYVPYGWTPEQDA